MTSTRTPSVHYGATLLRGMAPSSTESRLCEQTSIRLYVRPRKDFRRCEIASSTFCDGTLAGETIHADLRIFKYHIFGHDGIALGLDDFWMPYGQVSEIWNFIRYSYFPVTLTGLYPPLKHVASHRNTSSFTGTPHPLPEYPILYRNTSSFTETPYSLPK